MKNPSILIMLAVVLLVGVILGSNAKAHHDTETIIGSLTERIKSGETTAELYYRRAIEYRVLRRPDKAESDLKTALHRDQKYTPARRELARILSKQKKHKAAIQAAEQVTIDAKTHTERSTALILLGRILATAGNPAEALKHCVAAFELNPRGKVEWYLFYSGLLESLERNDEKPTLLLKGYEMTGSIVLRNAWIDALLDSEEFKIALPIIEKELATSRLKSSWSLRRARAYFGIGKHDAAINDLKVCLKELSQRIHPKTPDITLIADRGLANALLGRIDDARNDLARVQQAGADQWITAALERAISSRGLR